MIQLTDDQIKAALAPDFDLLDVPERALHILAVQQARRKGWAVLFCGKEEGPHGATVYPSPSNSWDRGARYTLAPPKPACRPLEMRDLIPLLGCILQAPGGGFGQIVRHVYMSKDSAYAVLSAPDGDRTAWLDDAEWLGARFRRPGPMAVGADDYEWFPLFGRP